MPQNKPKILTAEEIAKRREAARLKHALKNTLTKTEDSSETEFSTNSANTQENKSQETTQNENDIMFIAFGRIYSGTIRRGQEVYVLGPKHDPSKVSDNVCFHLCKILMLPRK